ncbi:MAG: response regulator transcription factor [Pseudomonadota bacterium]
MPTHPIIKSTKNRLLIVEDSRDLSSLLGLHMRELDCEVEFANTGQAGLEAAMDGRFDLVILDLNLPDISGLDICRRMRASQDFTQVLMLTARAAEADRVLGLEVGADHYVTKPFSMQELVARVRAILRRANLYSSEIVDGEELLDFGALCIDLKQRRVTVRQQQVCLTAKEFDLLLHFARSPGRVFTRSQLLDNVWGNDHDGYEHTVNSHINRLRAKIELDPKAPEFICTVWGVGYRLECNTNETPT